MYYNDDGETLDTLDFNQYHFTYSQSKDANATTLTLTNANKQITTAGRINANDDLDGISIYNAIAYGFDSADYSVTATMDDDSKVVLSDATYVQSSDRLVYNWASTDGSAKVSLPLLASIEFVRKA